MKKKLDYYTAEDRPIRCVFCDSTKIAEVVKSTIEGTVCEFSVECVSCGSNIGYWAQGHYQQPYGELIKGMFLEDKIDYTSKKSAYTEDNGLFKYGAKLIELGEMFQKSETRLEDLVGKCNELGLIISFRIEPDPKQSIDVPPGE